MQVHARLVPVKLGNRLVCFRDHHVLHLDVCPPRADLCLRKDNDRRKRRPVLPNPNGEVGASLEHPVGALPPVAVKRHDDRPRLCRRVVRGHVHLIPIRLPVKIDRPIKESRLACSR